MEPPKPTVLLVDDSDEFALALRRALRADYEVIHAADADGAIVRLTPTPDLILLDLRLREDDPENRESMRVLRASRQSSPPIPVVIITAFSDVATAVECMRQGAADFVPKQTLGSDLGELRVRAARALEQGRLHQRLNRLAHELSLVEPRVLIGSGPAMAEVRRVIRALARDGSATVLVRGETGTGKELVCRAIHAQGPRQARPFIAVTLSTLPLSILEGELFGYEAGAFTDARKRHIGYLERAHRGVLMLDEIGDAPLPTQVKLLRFLDEREFLRLGGTTPIRVDVQVIAATNADLERKVREGLFREDLYFRLRVHELVLPPLRQRREDIPPLIDHYLQLFRQQGKAVSAISPEAVRALTGFGWPGNVRQLRNALESSIFRAAMHGRGRIELMDLPDDVRQVGQVSPPSPGIAAPAPAGAVSVRPRTLPADGPIDRTLARTELACVDAALRVGSSRKAEVARRLAYRDRFALHRRVRRLLDRYPDLAAEYPEVGRAFSPARSRGRAGSPSEEDCAPD